jgi:hypothetical protein
MAKRHLTLGMSMTLPSTALLVLPLSVATMVAAKVAAVLLT